METISGDRVAALRQALAAVPGPILFAGLEDGPAPLVTLHTADPAARRALRRRGRAALAAAGLDARCEVRTHAAGRGSLARTVKRFRYETALLDPTRSVGRARALVCVAKYLRRALGPEIAGIYLEPDSRTLYVVVSPAAAADAASRLRLERQVADTVAGWRRADGESIDVAVRLGTAPPNLDLVAVDEATGPAASRGPLGRLGWGAVAAGVAALFGFGGAQDAAAQQPAVSGPNGKVSAQGGETRTKGTGLAIGSATLPLGQSLGFQFDAAGGSVAGESFWGVGGHMFWRDPGKGLVGVFGGHGNRGGDGLTRVGAAAEYFAGPVTLGGRGGYQFGDFRDGGFGRLDVKWYPTENLALSAGGEYAAGLGYGRGGVEFQPGYSALPGLSYFLDGEAGARDHHQVLAGVRYYFGKTKTLIKRHREDDPKDAVPIPVPQQKQFIPATPPPILVYGGPPPG